MKHSFKNPRYRICFQTKNKVWIYKNSRLRNFYFIRSKIVLKPKKELIPLKLLVTKNMKWTVARRQMVPYFKKRHRFFYFYKNLFFTKQQLKIFYGGLKEYQMRNLFKKSWNLAKNYKTHAFLGALEQRIGVLLFRMRLVPTIFACNQLISHHGILINNQRVTYLNYRVKLGDVLSIPKEFCVIFFEYLLNRLDARYCRIHVLWVRKFAFIKKIQMFFVRRREFYIQNLKLLKGYYVKKNLYKYFLKFWKNSFLKYKTSLNFKIFSKFLVIFFVKIFLNFKKIRKILPQVRLWLKRRQYFFFIKCIWFFLKNLNFNFIYFLIYFNFFLLQESFLKFKKNSIQYKQYLQLNTFFLTELSYIQHKQEINRRFYKFFLKNFYRRAKYTTILMTNRIKFKKKSQFRYFRYIRFLLKKMKIRKSKRKIYKNFCKQVHWYIPKYLEVDYVTLRICFRRYPEINEIFFGFLCSFNKIISFYKERAL